MVAFVGSGDQPAAALGSRVALGLGVAEVAAGRGPPLGEAPPRATPPNPRGDQPRDSLAPAHGAPPARTDTAVIATAHLPAAANSPSPKRSGITTVRVRRPRSRLDALPRNQQQHPSGRDQEP
jgi:hypothetical protein